MDSFAHDGLVFDVEDSGPADGDPVVLLHGWPQDASCWQGVTVLLNAAGLRTLAPSLRGYSRGARPTGRTAYRMSSLVGDVVALLDAAGHESAHIVGHDWGGALAWAFADSQAERVRSLTVLSTPHPAALAWAVRHADQGRKSWYMLAFQLPVLPEIVLKRRLGDVLRRSELPAQDSERYASRFLEEGAASGSLGWYRGVPASSGVMRAFRSRPSQDNETRTESSGISVPTTYLWGRRDPVLTRAAAERTGLFVDADYRFIEVDAGHWLPETQPEVVAIEVIARALG